MCGAQGDRPPGRRPSRACLIASRIHRPHPERAHRDRRKRQWSNWIGRRFFRLEGGCSLKRPDRPTKIEPRRMKQVRSH